MQTPLFALFTFFSLMIANACVYADWQLDNEKSRLSFISTKNNSVGEVHRFDKLSGKITKAGNVDISINLSSVNTNIDIRNTRMQKHLFEIEKFANATIKAEVETSTLQKLKPGVSLSQSVEFKLNLHGIEKKLRAELVVTGLASGGIHVSTLQPIIVNANSFELVGGIKKLQDIAKLSSIDTVVPVSLNLVFNTIK